jgi:hypothetical protein
MTPFSSYNFKKQDFKTSFLKLYEIKVAYNPSVAIYVMFFRFFSK